MLFGILGKFWLENYSVDFYGYEVKLYFVENIFMFVIRFDRDWIFD